VASENPYSFSGSICGGGAVGQKPPNQLDRLFAVLEIDGATADRVCELVVLLLLSEVRELDGGYLVDVLL